MKLRYIFIIALGLLSMVAFRPFANGDKTQYKCMIQLKNYDGEGAYVVASLLDKDGKYLETLQVIGDDPEWYHDLMEWWSYYGKDTYNIDAITGPTLGGSGQRAIKVIEIDNDKLDKGYKIRFETAVEDQEYFVDDATFDLTTDNLKGKKIDGTGFIRYVRMMPQK